MLYKLSFKNIKKSFKDYAIYFTTLILGVCIFYIFNSIDSQSAMLNVSARQDEMIELLTQILSYVSVFVSFILGFLIIYASRFLIKKRNKEFEHYYFLNLTRHFLRQNIMRFSQLINVLILLFIYYRGDIAIGVLLALIMAIFSSLWEDLYSLKNIVKSLGVHVKTFDYYQAYLQLSQDEYGMIDQIPRTCSVVFDDVCFTYPGTTKQILKHVSFKIEAGEKVALVGQNAEGKSTTIKLLLGLFKPDSGQITIDGQPLSAYTQAVREGLFGTVFQEISKYDISVNDNIGLGDVSQIGNRELILEAAKKANLEKIIDKLPEKGATL